jgi:hypothetical protein
MPLRKVLDYKPIAMWQTRQVKYLNQHHEAEVILDTVDLGYAAINKDTTGFPEWHELSA